MALAVPLSRFTSRVGGWLSFLRYWLRWVNTRGEKGPWSEPVSATIAG